MVVGCQLGWLACGQAVSLAVSLAVWLDGQDGREAVCLDGWLVVRLSVLGCQLDCLVWSG